MSEETINVLISHRENQGKDIAVLQLSSIDSQALPAFTAGAHIDVYITPDLVRQYSLSNQANDSHFYRIGVLKDPNSRGGSATLFEGFKAGQEIKISTPRNHFPLESHDGETILVAGGIGITPILSMAYELRKEEKPFEIHYCLRTESAGAFLEELLREFPSQFTLYCDDETMFDAVAVLAGRNSTDHLYTCGPSGFMDWVIKTAKEQGFNEEQIHFEYFNADVDTSGDSFEVYCATSDQTVSVGPDESIAEALSNAGIDVDVSCEQGVCGTCITTVLEGEPDHRDHFLSDEERDENKQITICCSRSKSQRLVLDI